MTGERWVELNLHEKIQLDVDALREAVEAVRKLAPDGQLTIKLETLRFERGQSFLDWVSSVKSDFQASEVKQ